MASRSAVLTPLALLSSLLCSAPAAHAQAGPCPDVMSTVERTLCIGRVLEQKDKQLSIAMQKVAADAAAVPGGRFPTIWKDSLTGFFKTSADPEDQVAAFQQARRNACVFMNSLAVQGTGFGIYVSNCEIRLTDALLQSLN